MSASMICGVALMVFSSKMTGVSRPLNIGAVLETVMERVQPPSIAPTSPIKKSWMVRRQIAAVVAAALKALRSPCDRSCRPDIRWQAAGAS